MDQLVFRFLQSDRQEPEVRVNGVDGEWIFTLLREVGVLRRPRCSHLRQALVAGPETLAEFLPELRVVLQCPHEKILVAVEDVFPVSDCVEQVEGLCSVASWQNTVAVTALYEGPTVHTIVHRSLHSLQGLDGRLQDLVDVDVQAVPPATVVPAAPLVPLVFSLLHIDEVQPGGQPGPAQAASLLAHLKREQSAGLE